MNNYYKIGGCLNPNHPTYVSRKADQDLFEYLQKGEYCFILNSRQMGKSSLRVKTTKKLRAKGVKCASIDLTLIGSYNTADKWYKGFADLLLDGLEIDTELDFNNWWNEDKNLPEIQRLYKLIELILINYISANIVIFIDEIDSIIKANFKDDFFAFIRACYNQKAEKQVFNRLTFCLLGVASPRDLIEDKTKTPFNIGHSIELTGLTFAECKSSLLEGLIGQFEQPENILQEILFWTGGQPFLTQKLCNLVVEKADYKSDNIEQIVKEYIINNWESQDEPEHLRTIGDRLINDDNKLIILLELYREIIAKKSILFNNSDEQIILRLTGLVVLKNNYLEIYNPIYQAVFNLDWLNYQLENKRPYSNYLKYWLQSKKDKSFLIQGKTLAQSQQWSQGKNLSNLDYEFLAISQTEQDKKENEILAKANQKAQKIIQWTAIIAILIIMATFFYTQHKINKARQIIQLEKLGNEIQQDVKTKQIESLIKAIETGKSLKKLVNSNQNLSDYPTVSPVSALLKILSQIQLKNQIQLQNNDQSKIKTIAISPDNTIIATGNNEGVIEFWERDGSLIKTPKPLKFDQEFKQNTAVFALKFSPNSQIIAAINEQSTVSIWDKNGTLISRFKIINNDLLQKYRVYNIEFNQDGTLLASGSTDGKIKIWSLKGDLLKTLQATNNNNFPRINSLNFSPNNKLIAVATEDGQIRIWQLNGKLQISFDAHKTDVKSVIFTSDNQQIISGGDDGIIKLWSLNGQLINTFTSDDRKNNLINRQPISLLKISNDGKVFASANLEGDIKIWSFDNPNYPQIFSDNNAPISSINFDKNGQNLIAASQSGQIKTWQVASILLETNPITSMAFNQNNNQLILGKLDGTIEIKTADNKLIKSLKNGSEIKQIFSPPHNQTFYTVSWDGLIQLWQNDGTFIKTVIDYSGNINDAAFNPVNQTVAIVNDTNSVQLFNLEGKFIKSLLENQKVTRLAFHPTGKFLAFITKDNRLNFWQNGGKITTIEESTNPITDLNFSPDGKLLASSYAGGIIKIWRSNGIPLLTLSHQEKNITSIRFNSDSKIIAAASDDGNVSFLPLTIDGLITQGCHWLKDYLYFQPTDNTTKICQ